MVCRLVWFNTLVSHPQAHTHARIQSDMVSPSLPNPKHTSAVYGIHWHRIRTAFKFMQYIRGALSTRALWANEWEFVRFVFAVPYSCCCSSCCCCCVCVLRMLHTPRVLRVQHHMHLSSSAWFRSFAHSLGRLFARSLAVCCMHVCMRVDFIFIGGSVVVEHLSVFVVVVVCCVYMPFVFSGCAFISRNRSDAMRVPYPPNPKHRIPQTRAHSSEEEKKSLPNI